MTDKEKRPAERKAPSGTVTMTFPNYNMFTPEEQEKALKIMELFWISLQVNGLNDRDSDKDPENHLPTMFFDFSGHVSALKFRCHMNGYKENYDYRNPKEFQCCEIKVSKAKEFLKASSFAKGWLRGILEGMKHDA